MNYDLLLLNVTRDFSSLSSAFRDNIGQYAIASYLRQKYYKAFVYSGNSQNCKEVIANEVGGNRTGVIGFYVAADNIRVVEHIVRWSKKMYPECITIVGGPQVAGIDYGFFERTDNDYAILGEGEIPMYYLLSSIIDGDVELSWVPSLVRRHDKDKLLVVNSSNNAIIEDLDSVGYPVIEDSLTGVLRQGSMAGIITGRGCPFSCSFCYEGANAKNVRFRSIPNVIEEIDYIREHNKKLGFISIYDDTFTLKKDRIAEFCKEIKKRNILWFCEGHVSFVVSHPEVLKMMIESGLSCIQFGIESGSDKVLDAYNKHTNYDMIIKAVEICKDAGIHGITGNFIIGGAHETRESFEKSKLLAKAMIHQGKGIIELYTVYFAPYPNTRMVCEPEKYGIEIHEEEQLMAVNTMRTPVISTNELSRNEIYDMKHEFDEFLAREYKLAADESRKSDILQGLTHKGQLISINPTWEKLYKEKQYIQVFLEHIDEKEQIFNEDGFIIRTFEDIRIEANKLSSEVGDFYGLEKDILTFATGVYDAKTMAEMFRVDIKEIEKCYLELNDHCLVYMSEF
jgi:radical SAM superfamily enzyme YgiQ (UPF0313 family)